MQSMKTVHVDTKYHVMSCVLNKIDGAIIPGEETAMLGLSGTWYCWNQSTKGNLLYCVPDGQHR